MSKVYIIKKTTMKQNPKEYLSLKIKAIREVSGLTQEELAEKCDVSWRTISNLERGIVMPSLQLICKLSKQFNISIDELFNNKIQTNKSLARLKKESDVIEEVMMINDNLLEHLSEYIKLLKKII